MFRHYLEVVVILSQKDFKVRYRNSFLGFIWSLLNPLAYMVILTVVFSILIRNNIQNFPAWLLVALLVWRFFTIGTAQSLSTIVGNVPLVTKVHVSRYVLVLSNNLANLIGAILEFAVMTPLLVLLGVRLTVYALLLPLFLGLEFLLVYALSLSLSSLNLKYRDFSQVWDIALQLGFFLSPILYDISLIPARFRFLYSLNPVTILILSFRDIMFYGQPPSLFNLIVLLLGIAVLMTVGFAIFHSLEGRFAEEI